MSSRHQFDSLRKIPLFAPLSDTELEAIAHASTEIDVPAGRVIGEQGHNGLEAFLIVSGSVSVTRNGTEIATLSDGQVAGELSMLDPGPRTATLTCTTDCKLLVVDQRHFRSALETSPTLMYKLLASLAGRVRALDEIAYG